MRSRSTGRPTGQHLQSRDGQQFFFDAGAVCLDFAYTGGAGALAVFETLHRPPDLASWFVSCALDVHVRGRVTDDELATALRLREAMRNTAWAIAAGDALRRSWLTTINRAAREEPLLARVADDLTSTWVAPTTSQCLATMAREMVELVTGPHVARIRACEAGDCPLVFVDTSRAGSRRWCSMARCGNRHKVRAFRERLS